MMGPDDPEDLEALLAMEEAPAAAAAAAAAMEAPPAAAPAAEEGAEAAPGEEEAAPGAEPVSPRLAEVPTGPREEGRTRQGLPRRQYCWWITFPYPYGLCLGVLAGVARHVPGRTASPWRGSRLVPTR